MHRPVWRQGGCTGKGGSKTGCRQAPDRDGAQGGQHTAGWSDKGTAAHSRAAHRAMLNTAQCAVRDASPNTKFRPAAAVGGSATANDSTAPVGRHARQKKAESIAKRRLQCPCPVHLWQTGRGLQCPAAPTLAARRVPVLPPPLTTAPQRATVLGPHSRRWVGGGACPGRWRRAGRRPPSAAPPVAAAAPLARLGSAAARCASVIGRKGGTKAARCAAVCTAWCRCTCWVRRTAGRRWVCVWGGPFAQTLDAAPEQAECQTVLRRKLPLWRG